MWLQLYVVGSWAGGARGVFSHLDLDGTVPRWLTHMVSKFECGTWLPIACVCERERERERENHIAFYGLTSKKKNIYIYTHTHTHTHIYTHICVCIYMYINISVIIFAKYNLPPASWIILIWLCHLFSAGILTDIVKMILESFQIWDHKNLLRNKVIT